MPDSPPDATMSDPAAETTSDVLAMEQDLTQLMTYLELLQTQPSNIPLVEETVSLARRCGMEEQVESGLEMLARLKGCPESIWLEVLGNISRHVPEMSMQGEERIQAVLDLLRKAIQDYLSIPVLLAVSRIAFALHPSPSVDAEDGQEPASTDSTITHLISEADARSILKDAAKMAAHDISFGDEVWKIYLDWEVALFAVLPEEERQARLPTIHQAYLDRLSLPHPTIADTAQAYSTFNSTYAQGTYEQSMVKASKIAGKSTAKWEAREAWEQGWVGLCSQGGADGEGHEEYTRIQKIRYLYSYLQMETSAKGGKKPEPRMVTCVYERWLAVCSEDESREGRVAEAGVWDRYITYLATTNGFSKAHVTQTLQRAARCCPHSGELWARLLRNYEILKQDPLIIGETYMNALALGVLTRKGTNSADKSKAKGKGKDRKKGKGKEKEQEGEKVESAEEAGEGAADQIVLGDPNGADVAELAALEAAWAGYMRRMEEANADQDDDDDEGDDAVEVTLREGLARCRELDPRGDPTMRLEKYLISWLESKGKVEEGIKVWDDLVKLHPKNYQVWIGYTDYLIRHNENAKARTQFKTATGRNVDWPESIWTAWIAFEDYHGSAESLNAAKIRVGPLQEALAAQRMQSTQTASQQIGTVGDAAPVDSASAEIITAPAVTGEAQPLDQSMDVDNTEDSRKRKADSAGDAITGGQPKRQRMETEKDAAPTRHREFATVLVSGLSVGVTEADIQRLFRECGQIREVTLSQQGERMVAAVEFMDRESVPAALTRDKKKIGDDEVHVYQAGHTTLFVTNFPEKMDDAGLRELFAPYGDIVETRWPSRKFKDSRRFCYVQFTTTGAAATASQELHGKELESGFPISVLISDPERKKERSDANADARELYVNQLSKFMNDQDMERVFSPFGTIKRISLAKDDEGKCKGFGFVEFETEAQARAALSLDGHEYKKRKMGVQLSEKKPKKERRGGLATFTKAVAAAVSRSSDILDRSVRLHGLPLKTQEGLLQQALGKIAPVKKVEVYQDIGEGSAELASAADVGALLLRSEPFVFLDTTITFSQETDITRSTTLGNRSVAVDEAAKLAVSENTRPTAMFQPRPPKSGLGARKKANFTAASISRKPAVVSNASNGAGGGDGAAAQSSTGGSSSTAPKGQDDFRKMLLEGKNKH